MRNERVSIGAAAREFWRFRTGKVIVAAAGLLVMLGMVFVFTLVRFVVRVNEMQQQYEAKLNAANARVEGRALPSYGLTFTDREVLQTLTDTYSDLIDSMGLTDQVHGYVLYYDLRPPDFLETPSSRIDFFLDCGCKRNGLYDLLTLEVDPVTLRASASQARRRVTQDQYRPLMAVERR